MGDGWADGRIADWVEARFESDGMGGRGLRDGSESVSEPFSTVEYRTSTSFWEEDKDASYQSEKHSWSGAMVHKKAKVVSSEFCYVEM